MHTLCRPIHFQTAAHTMGKKFLPIFISFLHMANKTDVLPTLRNIHIDFVYLLENSITTANDRHSYRAAKIIQFYQRRTRIRACIMRRKVVRSFSHVRLKKCSPVPQNNNDSTFAPLRKIYCSASNAPRARPQSK